MQNDKKEKTEEINKVSLTHVLIVTLKHWPWLLASLIIWLALAFIYLKVKQPTYMRTAKVLITDQSAGKTISSPLDAFSDMGMFSTNKVLLDEISKMTSPDLMESVVRRLGINTLFEKPGQFHRDVVYGDSIPVSVSSPAWTDDDYTAMTIDIAPNGDVRLSKLAFNSDTPDFVQKKTGRLGVPIRTPIGDVTVTATPGYVKGQEYTLFMKRLPIDNAVKSFGRATEIIREDDQANAVVLTVYDKSGDRAKDIISTIIDVYNENWVTNRNAVTVATNKFIDERLRAISAELGGVDKSISEFQSKNLLPDLEQAASIYLTDQQMADQQLLDLTNVREVVRYMRKFIVDHAHDNQVLPANTGIGRTSIEAQIAEYNEKLMERNRLTANSSANHPMISELDSQLASMRNAILHSLDNELASLNAKIGTTLGEKGKIQSQIAKAPLQANELLTSGRQQKVLENLYLFLLQKREENQLTQAFGVFNTEVIARPNGDKFPAKPRRPLIFGLALVMGLLTPFSFYYILEMLNTKVRDKKDLEGISAPIIGEIPEWKQKGKTDPTIHEDIVVQQDNRNSINDAFRVLRTNITFMTRRKEDAVGPKGCVFMVTSMTPGNGKSFVTANLAVVLALRGKKVLLIDGDLRHGAVSKIVGSPAKGISDYLIGGLDDWHKAIISDQSMQGAFVLPVGHFPPNPTELLETERFEDMIARMKEEYDYVFIDCPPISAMADARIIEKVSDRCIFVIRAGVIERSELPEVEKLYTEKTLKNMSIILNGMKTVESTYHSKYAGHND